MAQKGLVSLLLIAALLQVASCTVYPTWTYDGWEVIFLDRPSFLSSLHHSYHDELLYIFGQNSLRLVNSGRNFSAQDHPPAVEWNQPFISLHVFHNGSDLWAIGPTIPSDYTAYTEGYELPLAVTGPDMFQTQKVDGLQGYMLYNLFVDDRNHNDIVSYFVGYIPINGAENETVDQVAFGVVRVHLNLNAPFALRNFYFNYAVDVLPLTYNRYTIFGSHYKPFVHYQNQTNILIVVDPSNSNVHTIQVGPGTTPMAKLRTGLFTRAGTSISSSLFHSDTNLLFLCYAATGIGNGTVVAIDMSTFIIQHSITFSQELSNPRALAIDDNVDDTIYVGFNGGNAVVKLDYLLNVRGWQRVPPYMNHLEAARVGLDHVYLITNEQHSKVVRVNKTDFCPQQCPFYGYCKNGKCVCDINTQMSSDNTRCEFLTGGGMITDKGAAVALGVLFALTFIAAVLGWVLFWRARKSGYTAV